MLAKLKRLRLSIRVVVLAVVALFALLAAAYGYFAIRTSGAPASAHLGDAPESSGGPRGLNGEWVLASQNGGFAGYRVREVLGVLPAPNDAVGRTTAVRARLLISNGRIESAEATADLTQLRSDEEGRDPAAQMALATDRFPNGRFRLTAPIDLRSPRVGQELNLQARGALTLHGITKPVLIPLQARWNGDSFQLAGQVEVRRADFELEFPQMVGMRVSGTAKVEVELTFVHPGSGATVTAPTTESGNKEPGKPREAIARGHGRLLVSLLAKDRRNVTIYGVDLDGSHLARITRPAQESGYWTEDSHPAVSSDGRMLLYSRQLNSPQNTQPPVVYLARADGTHARELADGAEPSFSANGQKIAWLEGVSSAGSVQVRNRDSSSVEAATDGTMPDTDPALSPDGSLVAFSSFTADGNSDIFVVHADGSGRQRLTKGPEYDLTPSWSPDGRQVAFGRDGDIYVMAPNGSGVTRLTSGPARDGGPSWSPDGKRIAFVRSDETGKTFAGPSRLIIMNADGSKQRRVPLPREALSASWLPEMQ